MNIKAYGSFFIKSYRTLDDVTTSTLCIPETPISYSQELVVPYTRVNTRPNPQITNTQEVRVATGAPKVIC